VFRAPLLAGSRVIVGAFPDDGELLLPPPPAAGVADVAAAAREAFRFPLGGPPLEALVRRGARVTVVLDSAALPLPAPARDPRRTALAATLEELARAGVAADRLTVLVASGLGRRPGGRELEARVGAQLMRRSPGRVVAHDAADPALVRVGEHEGRSLRVNAALAEADAVVTVSAAESVLHGGAATLLEAADADTIRTAVTDPSLLEAGGEAWRAALAVERALAARVPVIGLSLALAHPRWGGPLRGVPYDRAAVERFARSPVRRGFGALPSPVRRGILRSLRPDTDVSTVFAGPPSVAHAEALLRGIEARGIELAAPLGTLVVGVPPLSPHPPHERPNPLLAAYLALGLALRLWRGQFPVAEGGALIFPHRFHRRFAHPTQGPYRAFFAALRHNESREPELLEPDERRAAADEAAIAAYRAGRSCHPVLPFADWAACAPARRHLGTVIVAGCRDAAVARRLGFVPARGLPAALAMAASATPELGPVGCLPTPPWTPLLVGEPDRPGRTSV
jgi:hypothetical protein